MRHSAIRARAVLSRDRSGSAFRGFTLIEMMVVISIMGVLLAYGLPLFQKGFEQSRVDLAAAQLQTLWTAERLYWAQNRVFASSVATLQTAGLLDPSFVNSLSSPRATFSFSIVSADATSFLASASRINSGRWSGALSINQTGGVSGQVNGTGGEVIVPSGT